MEFSLEQIETAIEARSSGPVLKTPVRGWSIDSRTISNGDLYFAIKGERHDGHAFTGAALEQGAVAAVVSQPVEARGTLLEVSDTVRALQRLAAWARRQWGSLRRKSRVAGSVTKSWLVYVRARRARPLRDSLRFAFFVFPHGTTPRRRIWDSKSLRRAGQDRDSEECR